MRQLTASEASNDETDFLAWWFQPEQDKLRTHCSPNWALIIWRASRKAIEIELPPVVVTSEIGPAISLEKILSRIALMGIKVKP